MDKKAIKSCSLFADLSEQELTSALSLFCAVSAQYRKGEILRSEGERMKFFGLVTRGTVQVFMNDINGDSIIMATVTRGGTFGESLSFLGVREIPVCIQATEDSEVLWLSCEGFGEEMCASPLSRKLYHRFVSMLAQRALDMNDRIQVLSKLTLREKLSTLFSQYAHKSGSRTFSLPLNREQLAAYLGVNRSALSRELCKMRDEGIIEFYKNSFKML